MNDALEIAIDALTAIGKGSGNRAGNPAFTANSALNEIKRFTQDMAPVDDEEEELKSFSCSVCRRVFATYSAYILHGNGACTGGF